MISSRMISSQLCPSADGPVPDGVVSGDDARAFAWLDGVSARDGRYFDTADWYRNFAATCLNPGDRWRIDAVFESGRPVLVLPLRERPDGVGPVAGRQLAGLSNFYSCRFAPLLGPGEGAGAVARWAGSVRRSRVRPGRLVFEGLENPSPEFSALEMGLRRAGFQVETDEQFGNWYLPVAAGGYDAWWAGRDSRLRHTVERKERALRSRHRVTIDLFERAEEAERAVALYQRVHAASWKPEEPYGEFMPGLIRSGLAAEAVWVGVLSVDGEPAAAQLWVVWRRRATIFKLSYAEALRRLSAGSVLTRHLIREAFRRGGVDEIDFGWGDDPYKRDWLPYRRGRWMLTAYDPATLCGAALMLRWYLPRRIKRWLLGRDGGGVRI
jgi:hypothetical protein